MHRCHSARNHSCGSSTWSAGSQAPRVVRVCSKMLGLDLASVISSMPSICWSKNKMTLKSWNDNALHFSHLQDPYLQIQLNLLGSSHMGPIQVKTCWNLLKTDIFRILKLRLNYVLFYGFLWVVYEGNMGFLRLRVILRVFYGLKPGFQAHGLSRHQNDTRC